MTDASQVLSTEERNNIEKLTLAALAHLPTAVLYVHDLTGECGTTVPDQVQDLLAHLMKMDVVCNLLITCTVFHMLCLLCGRLSVVNSEI